MADKFPMANVLGIDLSPIQPKWVPPNCSFEVDDTEKEWTHSVNYFDFIHIRNLAQSISDWPRLMSQAYLAMVPGGYVELVESTPPLYCDDGSMKNDDGNKIYCDRLVESLERIGRPVARLSAMMRYLEDAGFVDVEVFKYKQPVGLWPKEKRLKRIGAMCLLSCETGYEAYGMAFLTRILGMENEDALKLCKDALEAVRNKRVHVYGYMYVAYGRKPEEYY
ncbi:S-adenosyl-L-methionine-dependent methyltransferase [Tricharina praecox]|uniref:S-adenosyl-L-methionine-dependent methyltransferase n=1 Tax=Tricharina praecox TaxID=43433 RepID=UPI00222024B5|nr:S-adenosyl-L-methionine-dependent methyltransferase [Tricharina praecox]KAI5842817.1 S-adenosyl-L-methionine-dependent methyltransferase [Tricharina praecox]